LELIGFWAVMLLLLGWAFSRPQRSVQSTYRDQLLELRVYSMSAELRVDGHRVARVKGATALRAVELTAVLADGTGVCAGQTADPSGVMQPFLRFDLPQLEASSDPMVPELGTALALLTQLGEALDTDSDLVASLAQVEAAARRHAMVLADHAEGRLGGLDGEALAASHRRQLLALTSELGKLHTPASATQAADLRSALARISSAVEVGDLSRT